MAAGEKQLLRNQIRRSLNDLSPQVRAQSSELIRSHLEGFPNFQAAKVIYAFAPTPIEPDWMLGSLTPGKIFAFPRLNGQHIDFFPVKDPSTMTPGAFGILEPPGEEFAPEPDLILIPGVAYDMRGNRLGRGGGYYDRLLGRFGGYRLAIAFDFQVVLSVPTDPHDKSVQAIVSESGVRICHGGRVHHLP